MSKKDFIALADYLQPVKSQITPEVLEALKDFCKAQNPAFLPERWESYLKGQCGPSGGSRQT